MTLHDVKLNWKTTGLLPDKPYMVARANLDELNNLFPLVTNNVAKLWLYLNDYDQSKVVCNESGRNRRFISLDKGPLKYCGNQSQCICNKENSTEKISSRTDTQQKLINAKRASTNINVYGHAFASQSDETKVKTAATCLIRYGTISPTQNVSILEKSKSTCFKNRGVEFPQQDPAVTEITNKTFQEKYGVTRPAQHPDIQAKMQKTLFDKYGITNGMKLPDIVNQVRRSSKITKYQSIVALRQGFTPLFSAEEYADTEPGQLLDWQCDHCALKFKQELMAGRIYCPNCNPLSESWGESTVRKFLETHNIQFDQNTRKIIPPLELDFYIPSLNLAIEFNGIYWHSEKILADKNYHQNKFNACKAIGIKLIQIFEHELMFKQEIVFARLSRFLSISPAIKIGARNCSIVQLDAATSKRFFETNHLQGYRPSKNVWGLVYKKQVVAALSMGKARYSKNLAEWELLRFAIASEFAVNGAMPKLFKHAVAELHAKSVVSYANLCWGEGDVYKHAGFSLVRYSKPAPWYFKTVEQVYSRIKFQKHTLDNPNNLSESAWAVENNFNRFWDAGNAVWVWMI